MKKILIIPDSFKGTMTAKEVSTIMKQSVLSFYPDCEIIEMPISDGGEGSIETFENITQGVRKKVTVSGPYYEPIQVEYLMVGDNAIIEMATCAGIGLVSGNPNPSLTTTFGVGEIILDALKQNARTITLCVGGSATNDGGAGMLSALGVIFTKEDKTRFVPTGGTLIDIDSICFDEMKIDKDILITVICDVDNPLIGKNGAAHIYAPQKGADCNMVERLDKGLMHFADRIKTFTNIDISTISGGGAGGGIAAGVVGVFNSELKSGIDVILDIWGFENQIKNADLILTGEGKIDYQTSNGKAVSGIAKRAKKRGVPVVVVVGDIGHGYEKALDLGVTAVFSINVKAESFEESRHQSKANLKLTMNNIIRLIKTISV